MNTELCLFYYKNIETLLMRLKNQMKYSCNLKQWLREIFLISHVPLNCHDCQVQFIFCFLVKVTIKRKNQLSFSGKMRIFYTENKQTADFFFVFVTLTKKQMEWTWQLWTIIFRVQCRDFLMWNKCFVHPIFGFWFLVTYGDEVTKRL